MLRIHFITELYYSLKYEYFSIFTITKYFCNFRRIDIYTMYFIYEYYYKHGNKIDFTSHNDVKFVAERTKLGFQFKHNFALYELSPLLKETPSLSQTNILIRVPMDFILITFIYLFTKCNDKRSVANCQHLMCKHNYLLVHFDIKHCT